MKVDGSSPTLLYSSPFWTNNQLLNADVSSMNVSTAGDAKFQAFTTAPGTAVRLVMRAARATRVNTTTTTTAMATVNTSCIMMKSCRIVL